MPRFLSTSHLRERLCQMYSYKFDSNSPLQFRIPSDLKELQFSELLPIPSRMSLSMSLMPEPLLSHQFLNHQTRKLCSEQNKVLEGRTRHLCIDSVSRALCYCILFSLYSFLHIHILVWYWLAIALSSGVRSGVLVEYSIVSVHSVSAASQHSILCCLV